MKWHLALLVLVTLTLAVPFKVSVEYYNPGATKYLGVPYLSVSVTGDVDPTYLNVTVSGVSVNTTTPMVISNYTQMIRSALSSCKVHESPLISVVRCLMKAVGGIMGVKTATIASLNSTYGVNLNGYLVTVLQYSLSVNIYQEVFRGNLVYYAEGGDKGVKESLMGTLSTPNGYFLKIDAETDAEIGAPADYYKLTCAQGFAFLVAPSLSPVPPRLVAGNGYTKVLFPISVVKYVYGYAGKDAWVPKTVWRYYSQLQSSVAVPLSCQGLERIMAKPSLPSSLNCQVTFNVALEGEHTVTFFSPNGFQIKVRALPFKDYTIPVPCSGSLVMRVDNSTFMTSFDTVKNSKIVIVPKSKILRLVKIVANKKFMLDFHGYTVDCPPQCYLAVPPTPVQLMIVDPVTKASKLVLLGPASYQISVGVPAKPSYKSCGVYLIAPKPTVVTMYFNDTTTMIKVSNEPKYVVLPCSTPVTVKVDSGYTAKLTVNQTSWVVLCPGGGVKSGSVLNVMSSLKPPISFSCDNGASWVLVNSQNFLVVRPNYPLMILKFVGADGKMSQIYVPLGISNVTAMPNLKVKEKTQLPPNMPLTQLVTVSLHPISGPGEAMLKLSDGKYALTYPLSNRTEIAIPPQWTTTKLMGLLMVNTKYGMKMFNFTLPQLYSGKLPNGKPLIASVNIFSNVSSYNYYYHTVKVIILDQNGNPKMARITIDGKYPIEVDGATVIVYPKRIMTITFAGKNFKVALNGQSIYLNISTPQITKPLELNTSITVIILRNGKPASAEVEIGTGKESLTYMVNGTGKLAVPSTWLNSTLTLNVYYNGTLHQATLPKPYVKVGMTKTVAPIYVFLDDLNKYVYYSAEVVAVKRSGFMGTLADTWVVIDGKYNVTVNGAVEIVYPKQMVSLKYPGGELMAPLQGSVIYVRLPQGYVGKAKKETTPLNVTSLPGMSLGELIKKGVIKEWNPWHNLPATAMLATSLLLSLAIIYTAPSYGDLTSAIAFSVASLTVVLVTVALALYFASTIGAPP